MPIHDFFVGGSCRFEELSKYLDQLPQEQRIKEVTSLTRAQQSALWPAAEGSPRLVLEDFVPNDVAPLSEVIHWGRNSLGFASSFQKRVCRMSNGFISGYNHCRPSTTALVGTGYFVARETNVLDADDHGVVMDYTILPRERVSTWPPITPCSSRLGRFVYHGGRDYMRRVSRHVTIGGVIKSNSTKWLSNWFVLCREDPA